MLYNNSFSIESDKKDTNDEERLRQRRLEAERILSQFRSLTVTEQEEQRKLWTDELKLVGHLLVDVVSVEFM